MTESYIGRYNQLKQDALDVIKKRVDETGAVEIQVDKYNKYHIYKLGDRYMKASPGVSVEPTTIDSSYMSLETLCKMADNIINDRLMRGKTVK